MSTNDLDARVAGYLLELRRKLDDSSSPYAFASEFNHTVNNINTGLMGYIDIAAKLGGNQAAEEVSKKLAEFKTKKDAIVGVIKGMGYKGAFDSTAFYENVWLAAQRMLSDAFQPIKDGIASLSIEDSATVEQEANRLDQYLDGSGRLIGDIYKRGDEYIFRDSVGAREAASAEAATVAYAEEKESAPGKKRVLVVDDEPTVRDVVARMLGAGGYDVYKASGGQEAIQMLEEAHEAGKPYDGLVTDINMPNVSGKDVLEVAKRLRVGALALTGRPEEISDAVKAGAHTGLGKPVVMKDLLPKVESALSQYRS
ncbi:response regulator [Candidatus Woesearchaeota archaeon]|nr:response regulator [Candidatus Woesearchaeota archaeon]